MKHVKCALVCLIMACSIHSKILKAPPCVSNCGMLLESRGNGAISCETINEQEAVTLAALDKYLCDSDSKFCKEFACGQLFGWQVTADDAAVLVTDVFIKHAAPDGGVGYTESRIPVSGLSKCKDKTVWLGNDTDWRASSYAHEVVHMIQECQGRGVDSKEDESYGSGHEGWEEQGIYNVLYLIEVNGD